MERRTTRTSIADAQIAADCDRFMTYTCDDCKAPLANYEAAKNHFWTEHNSKGYAYCCQKKFKLGKPETMSHIKGHLNPKVVEARIKPQPKKKVQSKPKVIKAKIKPLPNGKDQPKPVLEFYRFLTYKCDACKKPLEGYEAAIDHFEKKHNSKGYGYCCQKKFKWGEPETIAHIERHLKSQRTKLADICVRPEDYDLYMSYNCDECDLFFKNFLSARDHFQKEHKSPGYGYCCQKKLTFSGDLAKRHIQTHLKPPQLALTPTIPCTDCTMLFKTKLGLRCHRIAAHDTAPEDKIIRCRRCKMTFKSQEEIKEHRRTAHLVLCVLCGNSFNSFGYSTHLKQAHPQKEPTKEELTCDICGKEAKNTQGLIMHRRNNHRDKTYSCTHCDYKTKNQAGLYLHVRQKHLKNMEKRFECPVCQKKYINKTTMMDHLSSHTGDRNHACEFCAKRFSNATNYYKHRKTAHPEEYAAWKAGKLASNQPKPLPISDKN